MGRKGSTRIPTMPFQQVKTGAGSSCMTAFIPASSKKYGQSEDTSLPSRSRVTHASYKLQYHQYVFSNQIKSRTYPQNDRSNPHTISQSPSLVFKSSTIDSADMNISLLNRIRSYPPFCTNGFNTRFRTAARNFIRDGPVSMLSGRGIDVSCVRIRCGTFRSVSLAANSSRRAAVLSPLLDSTIDTNIFSLGES